MFSFFELYSGIDCNKGERVYLVFKWWWRLQAEAEEEKGRKKRFPITGRSDRCIFMHLFLCIFPLINPCYTHFSVKLSIFSNFSVFIPKHRYSHIFWLFFRNFEATGILRMIMGGYSSNFGSIGAKMKNVKNRSFEKLQRKTRPSWFLPSETTWPSQQKSQHSRSRADSAELILRHGLTRPSQSQLTGFFAF